MSNKAPLFNLDCRTWLQAFRGIARGTDERTLITSHLSTGGVGNSAPLINYQTGTAVASALVMANMNSLPLDWAARLSVGGANMNFFIVKQLPVFSPDAYLNRPHPQMETYAELIVPRVLELIYTSHDVEGFARDLGYEGQPFPWDSPRRHRLQSELDAIFARMYHLRRKDLEWILDPPDPIESFAKLKKGEMAEYGEYRTRRLVLQAFDLLKQGDPATIGSSKVDGTHLVYGDAGRSQSGRVDSSCATDRCAGGGSKTVS